MKDSDLQTSKVPSIKGTGERGGFGDNIREVVNSILEAKESMSNYSIAGLGVNASGKLSDFELTKKKHTEMSVRSSVS